MICFKISNSSIVHAFTLNNRANTPSREAFSGSFRWISSMCTFLKRRWSIHRANSARTTPQTKAGKKAAKTRLTRKTTDRKKRNSSKAYSKRTDSSRPKSMTYRFASKKPNFNWTNSSMVILRPLTISRPHGRPSSKRFHKLYKVKNNVTLIASLRFKQNWKSWTPLTANTKWIYWTILWVSFWKTWSTILDSILLIA